MPTPDLVNLALAAALGLLIGLQRAWADEHPGGRTIALLSLLGAMLAILSRAGSDLILGAGLLAVTAALLVPRRPGQGVTTIVAGLVMFCVGVLCAHGDAAIAVVVTGLVAVLLQSKRQMRRMLKRIGRTEAQAVLRLVLVGMVILPALPDHDWGPFGVLNPFRIWLMVVLIVGISLAAWLAQRMLGARAGTAAAGMLGGFISSTATTIGVSRQARGAPHAGPAAAIIVLASTIVIVRVLVEILIVARETIPTLAPPLLALLGWMALASVITWLMACRGSSRESITHPPSDLRGAVIFGLLYAGVLLAVAAAREYTGEAGLYAVAALSGLTDMDAITLSTAQLVDQGELDSGTGWRLIVTGVISKLGFKTAIIAALGPRRLLGIAAAPIAWSMLGGAALIWMWPS